MSSRGLAIILVIILFATSFITSLLPASASQLDKLKKEQQQLSDEMKKKQEALEVKKRQEQSTLGELQTLAVQLTDLDREISRLERELAEAEEKVALAQKQLAEKIAQQKERQRIFRQRIVSIYEDGAVTYSEVLLQATSLTDFLTRLEYLKAIAENDVRLLKEIEAQRKDIEQRKRELEAKRDQIAALKSKREQRQNELARQRRREQELLASIRTQKEEFARMLDKMEEESKKLAAEIRRLQELQRRRSLSRGGKMLWPIPGYSRITSDYGMRVHPILRTRRMHTGIDIAAPMGATVVAALDGVVIYNGWYGAYGRTVIIDHGAGISTMYPHLSASLVRDGQEVRAGQKIAEVGSTGWSTGPHIHFEVRKNGDPVNPWPYLR